MSDRPMLADVARQDDAWRGLLGRADEFRETASRVLRLSADGALHAVGCGDGWFAASAAAAAPADGRIVAATALGFIGYARPGPQDGVVAISMSGNVDRTVEAAQAAKAAGASVLALTNGGGGRLAGVADGRLSLNIPELAPFLCGTTTYTATILGLWLLCGIDEACRAMVHAAAGSVPAVIGEAERVCSDLFETPPSGVRFLSAGANRATADYGAAKLVELTRTPAWSDDIEEFAHRQFWAMPESDLVVYLAANSTIAHYAAASADALGRMGVATLSIETADCPVATARLRIILPEVPEWLSPLLAAVPLQILAYRLAERTGFDPDHRPHLKTDAARFATSRLLTRRTLLGSGS
jgi:glucosamine 6-phosphate synthetase-like amidotransferase/phosphosugar isomerase protein